MPAADVFFQAIEPLRLRYLDSPVPGWFRATREVVNELLPTKLRQRLGAQQRQLLLSIKNEQLCLQAQLDGELTLVGELPINDADAIELLHARLDENAHAVPRWLLLDASQVLRRVLTLPASAEPRLREVLTHEIDRQTPFSIEQVSFESRVLSHNAASRQLRVELVVVPKTQLEVALSTLGPMARGLAGIDVVDTQGGRVGVNLLPAMQRRALTNRSRNLNVWLSIAMLILLVSTMMLALHNRRVTLEKFKQREETVNVQVRQVRKLRNALDTSMQAIDFLVQKRAQQPTMLALLNDLTHRIPDDTSLQKLSVNEGDIELVGQSKQAPALVAVLQGSPLLKTPALAGAVQTDPRSGGDRFTLTATVAGSKQEDADVKSRQNP